MAWYRQVDYAGNPIWQDSATGQVRYDNPEPGAKASPLGFDVSQFQQYLQYAGGSGDIANSIATSGAEGGMSWASVDPNWLANPQGIFDVGFNVGSRRSLNPYFSTGNRDALRNIAQRLGLSQADADRAALQIAQEHLTAQGGGYTDASSGAIVGDDIARVLFRQAGKDYNGLTPEQRQDYAAKAAEFQGHNKDADQEAWKQDDFAGMFGAWSEQMQNIWEGQTNDGLPSERALQGADNPWNTWLQNKLRNEDYDPYGNEYGLPTKQNYQKASEQGYDTGASAFLQNVAQQAASWYLGASGISGEVTNLGTSGVDPSYVNYAKQAKTYADYYKAWENYKAGGEFNPGALVGVATKAVGDFDAKSFTGGESPYNANSFFENSSYGNNYAGGNVYDESGNWMDGEYDIYGNFVPSDQTQFGDDYGELYGQGNDIFGGGNLEQSNPELFGSSSGLLSGLGGLFSGLGNSVSGLLGSAAGGAAGAAGGGSNLLALAPILAGIQYARNQGPFDTSRLTGLADRYNPDAMAYQYDRNTEDQRRSLNSSLSDRGVMGSSFGNMDITNFNTNRELGRGALISQASLGGADIAQKILNAQIQERQLRNQMYGSSLYALGNVFRSGK